MDSPLRSQRTLQLGLVREPGQNLVHGLVHRLLHPLFVHGEQGVPGRGLQEDLVAHHFVDELSADAVPLWRVLQRQRDARGLHLALPLDEVAEEDHGVPDDRHDPVHQVLGFLATSPAGCDGGEEEQHHQCAAHAVSGCRKGHLLHPATRICRDRGRGDCMLRK